MILTHNQPRLSTLQSTNSSPGVDPGDLAAALAAVPHAGLPGKLAYFAFPIRRRVVLENLRRVFGANAPPAQIRRLAQATYGHFIKSVLEWRQVSRLPETRRRELVEVENAAAWFERIEPKRGVILMGGHFGNWEIVPRLLSASFPDREHFAHVLRRPVKPRWLEPYVLAKFRARGAEVLSKSGSLPQIFRLLRQGRSVVFIMDQHAARKEGVMVDFLGHPVCVFRSLAILALRTGAPIVPFCSWREPDGKHVLRFEDALPTTGSADTDEAVTRITQDCLRVLERFVLAHPEQWFWFHRLWKAAERLEESSAPPAQ